MKPYALILVLLQPICLASPTRANEPVEPDAVYVEKGDKAPFEGILFPPARAERLGSKLETCELHRDLDAKLAADKGALQLEGCTAKLQLVDAGAKEREAILRKALEDAREQGRRELWEKPEFVLAVGVLVGIAVTVGGVYLLGVLRPTIPAASAP